MNETNKHEDRKWPEKSPEELLVERIWITKHARFNAHKRLRGKEQYSTAAIAFLSAYLVVAAIAPLVDVFAVSPETAEVIAFGIAAGSVLILVLSLLEHRRDFSLRASRFHICGMKLSELYDEAEVMLKKGSEATQSLSWSQARKEYRRILQNYQDVNHALIDYRAVKYEHPHDFNINRLCALMGRLEILIRTYGVYLLLILAPPVIVAIALFVR